MKLCIDAGPICLLKGQVYGDTTAYAQVIGPEDQGKWFFALRVETPAGRVEQTWVQDSPAADYRIIGIAMLSLGKHLTGDQDEPDHE